jgi:para-aminobenzoate synthetase component I
VDGLFALGSAARSFWDEAMIIEEIPDSPPPEVIARSLRNQPGFFYLDSAREEGNARPAFSFIGFDPFLTWRTRGDRITVEREGACDEYSQEPLGHLRELMSRYRSPGSSEIPFIGGAVGYFGYEFGARGEGVHASSPDESDIPAALFGFHDGVIACELSSGKTFVVANPVANRSAEVIASKLRLAVQVAVNYPTDKPVNSRVGRAPADGLISNLTHEAYLARVARVKEYIAAGDVYQVNFAQRFAAAITDDPYAIYQRLRTLSPAPFGAYLDVGEFQILSSSPELFLRLDRQGRAVTRPIKGTRPRGRTEAEDQLLAAELSVSEKDHAELLMIVDLERNDLGRVCRYGSIQVDERYRIEAHPTVFHLVSTISGQLRDDADVFDCLRSMLPGGSITGAPKIRAMQIIDELESCRRHVYTGSLGYLGFDGTCDLNIAIRTILCREGRASYHVGGGIVADSDPEAEYQETLAKGRAMRAALLREEKP